MSERNINLDKMINIAERIISVCNDMKGGESLVRACEKNNLSTGIIEDVYRVRAGFQRKKTYAGSVSSSLATPEERILMDVFDCKSTSEVYVIDEFREALEHIMKNWSPRRIDVFELRYYNNMTLTEVGNTLGISKEMVRQYLNMCLRSLRHHSNIKILTLGLKYKDIEEEKSSAELEYHARMQGLDNYITELKYKLTNVYSIENFDLTYDQLDVLRDNGIETVKDYFAKLEELSKSLGVSMCCLLSERLRDVGNIPLKDLGFSTRAYNCLKRAGITDSNKLCELTKQEVRNIRNLGVYCLQEIEHKITKLGLSLRKEG